MSIDMNPSRSIARRYIVFTAFFSTIFWVPVFFEVQRHFSVSIESIYRIQSIYYFFFCFVEIPTGLFADRFGNKLSMIVGSFVCAMSHAAPLLFPTSTGFLGQFLCLALGRSLVSGAASSWLYISLQKHGALERYTFLEGRARSVALMVRVFAWTVAGYLHAANPLMNYGLSAFCALAAMFIMMSFREDNAEEARVDVVSPRPTTPKLWTQLSYLRKGVRPEFLALILQGVGLFLMVRLVEVNLFQPLLKWKLFPIQSFGIILAAMSICEALGSNTSGSLWFSNVSRTFKSPAVTVAILASLMAFSLGNLSFAPQWGVLSLMFLFAFMTGLCFPLQKKLIQSQIDDNQVRASLLSLESLVDRGLCALILLPVGYYVEAKQFSLLFVTLATISILIILCGTLSFTWLSTKGGLQRQSR